MADSVAAAAGRECERCRLTHWDEETNDAERMVNTYEVQRDLEVATRKVKHALQWLVVFFRGQEISLAREYLVDQWWQEPEIWITTDASPWGLGASLHIRCRLMAVISSELRTRTSCGSS